MEYTRRNPFTVADNVVEEVASVYWKTSTAEIMRVGRRGRRVRFDRVVGRPATSVPLTAAGRTLTACMTGERGHGPGDKASMLSSRSFVGCDDEDAPGRDMSAQS